MADEIVTLTDTRDHYLKDIARSLRLRTVVNSRTVINGFIRYLNEQHPDVISFSKLKRSHITAWLASLASQPLRTSTRRNKVIKLKVFLRRIQEDHWEEAPQEELFRKGDLPSEDKALPRPLSADADEQLQDELRRRGGFIHKCLLLLRATGLRAQEFLDLEIDALRQRSDGTWCLHVPLGKLHSERVIPVSSESVRLFSELLNLRGTPPPVKSPETGKLTHFLVVHPDGRRFGKRFGRDVFRYHLGKIKREAKLRDHPTPHRLRHSLATELLRAGLSLPALMKILGHRTIGMTLRYAAVTGVDVARAYAEAIKALEERHNLPSAPDIPKNHGRGAGREGVVSLLHVLEAALEAYRRDHAKPSEKRKVQRFVERIRRLTADFKGLVS
jgi:site-specific recombinase XerD